jgi:hypothetical protein
VVELADIMRGEWVRYCGGHRPTPEQYAAVRAITGCRTDAMGSVTNTCDGCSTTYSMPRSCRNRHCPKCQRETRAGWLEKRKAEILPVPYSHVVFTPPAELTDLALSYPREFYGALMSAAGHALTDVGWSKLRVRVGCEIHLHTWGEDMPLHPHTHCVVPCGGFAQDGRWVEFEPGALPAEALASRFRVLLCRAIRAASRQGKFAPLTERVEQIVAAAETREWRVYAEPPFGGPEQLLGYLARYMYRVAITNDRIQSYENDEVTFSRSDSGRGRTRKPCTLPAQEFVRRFVLHVLPKGFVRVRRYGFLSNRNRKANDERARERIGEVPTQQREPLRPLRLCPACYEAIRNGGTPPAPRRELAPQLVLMLRPPPEPVAA